MHGPDISDLDLPDLTLYPSTTGYSEQKRCFKQCVKDMSISYLNIEEESCSKNCLSKYIQAQIFLSQKMTNTLTQLVTQDPSIKIAFKKPYKLPEQ
ncbi:unnamed protein product (macronuclear) [Paramecium tetraurelia]|uniref:Mitochondrial import inner membrane translocase subunit n=1 Tax=Paramecium tetraurelia TaxID=5888 RepID=A0CR10_PARTE|nr:uncharacterized protein GSPATT00009540001 [Paramecium tetraurelia]CAK73227.1 unnamed protein product [Paramecium tetraurelia]|eukprot:XP_001440624.1 hypothetical protein (macronuclear) [Paramecium tetraurelia strain d4-2]